MIWWTILWEKLPLTKVCTSDFFQPRWVHLLAYKVRSFRNQIWVDFMLWGFSPTPIVCHTRRHYDCISWSISQQWGGSALFHLWFRSVPATFFLQNTVPNNSKFNADYASIWFFTVASKLMEWRPISDATHAWKNSNRWAAHNHIFNRQFRTVPAIFFL